MYDVGSFVAPVADHALAAEFSPDDLLVRVVIVSAALELTDLLQTSCRAHELENTVDGESASKFSLEG